jgi:hypothetical protein
MRAKFGLMRSAVMALGYCSRGLLSCVAWIVRAAALLTLLNALAMAQVQTDASLPGGQPVLYSSPPDNHVTRSKDGRTPLAQHERGNPAAAHTIYYRITLCDNLGPNDFQFVVPQSDQKALGLTGKSQADADAKTSNTDKGGVNGINNGSGSKMSIRGTKDGTLTYKLTDNTGNVATIVLRVHYIKCDNTNDGFTNKENEISMAVPLVPNTDGAQYATMIQNIPALGATDGQNVSYAVPLASDTTHYCTFGEGTPWQVVYTPANSSGDTIVPDPQVPKTDGRGPNYSPGPPLTPPITPPTDNPPPATTSNNTPSPTTPDNPPPATTTTDNPPTQPPPDNSTATDNTPTVHITIYIKATEAVVTGGQTGQPIGGQIVKLIFETPDFPSTQEQKTADDTAYDQPAPQSTTDAGGQAQIQLSNDDKKAFGLTQNLTSGGKPVTNYRVSLNMLKHDGLSGELTGHAMPNLNATLLPNGNFIAEQVQIAGHTYVRIGANTPYGSVTDLVDTFSKLLGVTVVIDICIIKEPGPPLGSEPATFGALNHDLPQASVMLARPARMGAGR